MTISSQRWKPTQIGLDRLAILTDLGDGRMHQVIPKDPARLSRALRSLEQRGLIVLNDSTKPIEVQVVLPEQTWLLDLEHQADDEMRKRDAHA